MTAEDQTRARSNRSLQTVFSADVDESWSVTAKWIWKNVFLDGRPRWVIDCCWLCMAWLIKTGSWKLKQVQVFSSYAQFLSLEFNGNGLRWFCSRILGRRGLRLLGRGTLFGVRSRKGKTSTWKGKTRTKKGKDKNTPYTCPLHVKMKRTMYGYQDYVRHWIWDLVGWLLGRTRMTPPSIRCSRRNVVDVVYRL